MAKQGTAKPFTLTIFGITGDLAARMLLPALHDLVLQKLLPPAYRIVGISRRGTTTDELLDRIRSTMQEIKAPCDEAALRELGDHMELVTMDASESTGYARLRTRLDAIEDEVGMCMHRLFYMAIPSSSFKTVVEQLGKSGLNKACPHGAGESRLLIEKPFGSDLSSAKRLIERISKHFDEQQIYRIDHFLAKETAQNVLALRFENALFRTIWDRQHINRIVVTATETMDINDRASFYEQTGALRDVVQNHVLQMLALVAMDVPDPDDPTDLHRKKLALLTAIEPVLPAHAVRGQYKGYREQVKNDRSFTETYAALQINVTNDRWHGVPVLLQAGKALAKDATEITITFTDHDRRTKDNTLTIRLGHAEGISLGLHAKKPGHGNKMQNVVMEFQYYQNFPEERHPTAYERVLVDALHGDQTLFATSDEVLASWRILDPVIQAWGKSGRGLQLYPTGSDGPNTNIVDGTIDK